MSKKVRPKFNTNYQAEAPKVAYVCDGHGCDKQCADTMTAEQWYGYKCHHTMDESHAANKVRRNRKFKCDKDKNGVVKGYTEVFER